MTANEQALNLLLIAPLSAALWYGVIWWIRTLDAIDVIAAMLAATTDHLPTHLDVAAIEADLPRLAYTPPPVPVLSIVDKLDAARVRLEVAA